MAAKRGEKTPSHAQGSMTAGYSAEIPSDVLGSYTGMAKDGSRPIQDADDL